MADEITKFEQHKAKYAASMTAVAESMRNALAAAESFAAYLNDSPLNGVEEGEKKSRKRKGAADIEDDKPAKRKRKAKDPNAPKRPASSYIMFQNDIRKDLKEKNPHLSNPDLLALISQKWSEMSEEDKAVYNKAVASAKEQYSNEKKAYDARSPEEVAAANAANEAAIAAKKAQPRTRAPKAQAAAAAATPATTIHAETSPSNSDTDDSDSSDEEAPPSKKTKPAPAIVVAADSDEEDSDAEDDDSEEEAPKPPVKPASKAAKTKAAAVPAPTTKTSKKKSTK
ncbi:hypothetical protein DXG01_013851 [Tephrocybe rancida]|nr:hypothetical protein DXG01_013851 [Tephrocybe rancida]